MAEEDWRSYILDYLFRLVFAGMKALKSGAWGVTGASWNLLGKSGGLSCSCLMD